MPVLKQMYSGLSIKPDIERERARFVNRITNEVFGPIQHRNEYTEVFGAVCTIVGANYEQHLGKELSRVMTMSLAQRLTPPLSALTRGDFTETLAVTMALYECYERHFMKPDVEMLEDILLGVEAALKQAVVDLGVKWKEGVFYASGAKELDTHLLEEPLEWMSAHCKARGHFQKAMAASEDSHAVVEYYVAVETFARELLSNDRVLQNNIEALLQYLNLSKEWGAIMKKYLEIANEYSRHASRTAQSLKPHEAEAFLYLTGLILRLALQHVEAQKRKPYER